MDLQYFTQTCNVKFKYMLDIVNQLLMIVLEKLVFMMLNENI